MFVQIQGHFQTFVNIQGLFNAAIHFHELFKTRPEIQGLFKIVSILIYRAAHFWNDLDVSTRNSENEIIYQKHIVKHLNSINDLGS